MMAPIMEWFVMSRIFLVQCVSKKLEYAARADELYISPWFLKAKRYVESRDGIWFILSAKHGLLKPNDSIDPYNLTLNNMNADDRRRWGMDVCSKLKLALPVVGEVTSIEILAGHRYRVGLIDQLHEDYGEKVLIPMEGRGFGQQLQWFNGQAGGID